MASQLTEYQIREFGTLVSLQDTSDLGTGKLTNALNCKLRPYGAISGPAMRYFRLWAIGNTLTIYQTLDALTHPSGSGTLSNSDLTVAVRIYKQGVSFLLLYSMPDREARGLFYLGRDAGSNAFDFDTGPPSYEVLAVGLNRYARWYGTRAYTQIFLNNGVDDGVVVQLHRTKLPGKWRKAGSNERPGTPSISLVTPGTSTLSQAYWTIPGANTSPFTADPATDTLTTPGPHNLVNGTIVRLTTSGTLPAGLNTGTDYYVIAATTNTLKVSLTLDGDGVDFTDAGTGTHTVTTFGTTRAGVASLTFTANVDNLPGAAGNDRIRVSILFSPYGGAISSTLTGTGTLADPYLYTILTTTSGNTTDQVVAFVNADTKVLAILSASKSAADATADGANYGPTLLTNGGGTGTSEGFTNKTATVYARYFDSGAEHLGYEGISSEISNTIIINAATNSDIRVSVPINPEAADGRFDQIRVYLQFGEGEDAQWNLMDGENPISNVERTGLFIGNPATSPTADSLFAYSATQVVTASVSTDFIQGSTPTPNGSAVMFTTTGTVPTGLTAYKEYFAVQASGNNYKVSLTLGGAAINITGAGTGTHTAWTLAAHGLHDGDAINVSATGTLPAPLTAREYFVTSANTRYFKVTTTAGGAAVNLTTMGTPACTYDLTRAIIQLGTTSTIGQIMSVDQNRPPPHSLLVTANEQTWSGGVTGFQDRLYVSKPASNDELAPEGANAEFYERVESPKGTTGVPRMTALYSDDFKIHVHTADGVTLIDPQDPSKRYSPPVVCGAINQSALTPWPGSVIYYLGADFQIYTISGLRYGKQQVEFAARDAAMFVLERTNVQAALDEPDRIYMFPNVSGQMLWYFLPAPDSAAVAITGLAATDTISTAQSHGLRLLDQVMFPTLTGGTGLTAGTTVYFVKSCASATEFTVSAAPGGSTVNFTTDITAGTFQKTGNRTGFAYDFLASGLIGPIDYPKVYDSCTMEPSMPQLFFCDEMGNLFYSDPRLNLDFGDNYGAQTAPIPHNINALPPPAYDGYGMVDYDAYGNGVARYYPAQTSVWETGFVDLGRAASRKAFSGFIWSTVQGSRGFVELTFTAMNNQASVTRIYGDLGEFGFQQVNKILASLNTTSVKIKMQVISSEQNAWTVRNGTMLLRQVKNAQI